MKFVIMAGGLGSKLWPYSRSRAPKQFIKIVGEKTLFQMNLEALLKRYAADDIFVSVTEELVHFVEEQAPQIPKENYIVEPMMRDTGPAACLAMTKVAARYPNEIVYFYVQPVVVREPDEKYLDMIEEMERLVKEKGKLVTGTKIPEVAETGSDFFKMGKQIDSKKGMKIYEVDEFINVVKERMTLEQVEEIAKKFVVGIHTNHYTWIPEMFFKTVKKFRPDWYEVIEKLKTVIDTPDERKKVAEIYGAFEPARFEVVTTELIKEGGVIAVVLPFEWIHITTWGDVYRYRAAKKMPTVEGEVIEIEGEKNLIMGQKGKLIAMVGMKETVVVDTGDAIFIAPRSMSGKIKEVTDKLQEEKFKKYS